MVGNLSYPMAFEHNGLLYLIGYRGRAQYVRRSADGGQTWLAFSDGKIEKPVATPSDAQRVAFVKMETQGCRLVVGVPNYPHIDIYVSVDDGAHWELDSRV